MKGLISFIPFLFTLPAHAGVVIYGTRVIYPAEKNEVLVQLMNQGERSSLVQSWIDDGDSSLPPEKIHVPFMLTPPVAKIAADSGQQLKIKKMGTRCLTTKKVYFFSMFWIFRQTILIAQERMYSSLLCRIGLNYFIDLKVSRQLINIRFKNYL